MINKNIKPILTVENDVKAKAGENQLLNSLSYQIPKIDSSLDEERKKKIYSAIKSSEPFKDNDSITVQSFSDVYAKIKYEHFSSGEIVFSHGKAN